MQDPSGGLQQPLDKHLHLISSHQFPLVAQLNLQQAFEYLVQAPSIVKQVAPMSWTYVQPPQEGTIWLEWLSPAQNGGRFPTDGYVWADVEQGYRHTINGYTIELMMHSSGFRPGFDHMTSHARTRYHLIAKQGHINAPPPDPSLWIVHYHHAAQQRVMPTQQVPIDAFTRQMMQDRQWLESQGRIERRDFMLHDREHWPHIAMPGSQQQRMQGQPGFYPPKGVPNQGMMPPNYSQTPFPQPPGQPSAKRQRLQGPGQVPQVVEAMVQDFSIEDEEYTALGDYFDHLTPREISLTRFQQHHKWMEEVFSSPYTSTQIVPADLGLGLMGELKGLTEGILEPPAIDEYLGRSTVDGKEQPQEAFFTKVPREQVEQFNARVQKHIDEGKTEIERMKAEHAIKMREWRKTYKLTQAERQLRTATWKGHESAIFRPSEDAGELQEEGQAPAVQEIVERIEELTGLKVQSHADASLVAKGGLEEVERPAQALPPSQQQSNPSSNAPSEAVSFQQSGSNGQLGSNNVQQTAPSAGVAQAPPAGAAAGPMMGETSTEAPELDMLNDSMDIDGADLNFDLGDTPADSTAGEGAVGKDSGAAAPASAAQNMAITGSAASNGAAQATSSLPQQEGEMFNDTNFDFENEIGGTGDEVGDGLIDFGDEGLGDDSAFGDALHGMDA